MLDTTALLFIFSGCLVQYGAAMISPLTQQRSPLISRGGDGVYLTNCHDNSANSYVWSQFSYYANFGASQSGQFPDDTAVTDSSGTSETLWEGEQICHVFQDTGVEFCSVISQHAASLVGVLPSTLLTNIISL